MKGMIQINYVDRMSMTLLQIQSNTVRPQRIDSKTYNISVIQINQYQPQCILPQLLLN